MGLITQMLDKSCNPLHCTVKDKMGWLQPHQNNRTINGDMEWEPDNTHSKLYMDNCGVVPSQ